MAAVVDPNFDSSDIEFEPTKPEFPNLGSKSIQRMEKIASELRVSTKKASKELKYCHGSISNRKLHSLWTIRWEHFLEVVLKKDVETHVPTGEDLERFFHAIPEIVVAQKRPFEKLKDDKPPPSSYTNMKSALSCTLRAIRIRHDNFFLKFFEQERMKSTFQTLLNEGKITKSAAREKRWLSANIISQFTMALFLEAIWNGTYDWSAVINGSLSLSLQSALGCRVGDMARSNQIEDPFMCVCYRHVEIALQPVHNASRDTQADPQDSLPDDLKLQAKIKLEFTKGKRNNQADSPVYYIDSLRSNESADRARFNSADPVKLLVIQALRTGAIADVTTAHDLLEMARKRPGCHIKWAFPDRPVLGAYEHRRVLQPEVAARVAQVDNTLNRAANLCGIYERLRTQDIRRGAASDVVQLPSLQNLHNAVLMLDHEPETVARGVTRKYVGPVCRSTFQERMDLANDNPFGLKPQNPEHVAAVNEMLRKKIPSVDVNSVLMEDAMEQRLTGLQNPRGAALNIIKQRRLRYASTHISQLAHDETMPSLMPDDFNEEASDDEYSSDDDYDSGLDSNETNDTLIVEGLNQIVSQMASEQATEAAEDIENTQAAQNIVEFDASGNMVTTQIMNIDDDIVVGRGTHALDLSAIQFIDHFSRRNDHFVAIGYGHAEVWRDPQKFLVGGSRDIPSFKTFFCKNTGHGCTTSNTSPRLLSKHEKVCKAAIPDDALFHKPCPDAGCEFVATSSTEHGLYSAIYNHRKAMQWQPTRCVIGGFDVCDRVFETRTSYAGHQGTYHDREWTPKTCPLNEKHTTTFDSFVGLRAHFKKTHKLKDQALEDAMVDAGRAPPKKREFNVWIPTACPINPNHKLKFSERGGLYSHLRTQHNFTTERVKEELTRIDNRRKEEGAVAVATGDWEPMTCPKDNTHTFSFTTRDRLRNHFKNMHKDMTSKQANELINDAAGKRQRSRAHLAKDQGYDKPPDHPVSEARPSKRRRV